MKILITGAAGLLAGYLVETAPLNYELGLTYHQHLAQCSNCELLKTEITDLANVLSLWERFHPQWVIHAAGIADVDYCQKHPKAGYLSNVLGTQNIIAACQRFKSRLLYVSTNAVYKGDIPPYSENSPQLPINEYGGLKKQAEELVRQSRMNWAIVRPILMYGWSRPWSRKNFAVWIIELLESNKAINLVNDVRENPLSAEDCARSIWKIIALNLGGEFNLAGRDMVSRYELGLKVADVFGLDKSLIQGVRSAYFKDIALRPANTSFDTTKIERELMVKPLGLEDGLRRMKETEPANPNLLIQGRLNS